MKKVEMSEEKKWWEKINEDTKGKRRKEKNKVNNY